MTSSTGNLSANISVENIRQYEVLPENAIGSDDSLSGFSVTVNYRGEFRGKQGGGWSAENRTLNLSRALKWGYPERYQRWQYRWETFEEALEAAQKSIEGITMMGRDWKGVNVWMMDNIVEEYKGQNVSMPQHLERLLHFKDISAGVLLAKLRDIATDPHEEVADIFDESTPLTKSLAESLERIFRISADRWLDIDAAFVLKSTQD